MSAVLKKVGTTPHWILKRESPPGFAQFLESAIHILPQLPPLDILYSFIGKLHPFTLTHPYHFFLGFSSPRGILWLPGLGISMWKSITAGRACSPCHRLQAWGWGPLRGQPLCLGKSPSLSMAVIPKCFAMCCTAHSKCKAVLIFDKAIPTIN